MWQRFCDRPGAGHLGATLERLGRRFGGDIDFVCLYGSMARGDFGPGSDFDLFVAMCHDDGERFLERMARWGEEVSGPVEVLVYSRSEVAAMMAARHPLLLVVLDEGVPLIDNGGFARLRAEYERCRERGLVRRVPRGFDLTP